MRDPHIKRERNKMNQEEDIQTTKQTKKFTHLVTQ